ncbi:hypothetical protein SVAN01_10345 [Stagonosporopsis vannaccii]|nr:hypothetical protein SVAN01_10345 [Stagonosporopsis vannaccii]
MANNKLTIMKKAPDEVSNRLKRPKESGKPFNPMEPKNWKGVEPKTEEEMVEWLDAEKKLLQAYLLYYKRLSEHEVTHQRIANAQSKVDEEWQNWEPECDQVFGEILDEATRKRADHAMAEASRDLKKAMSQKMEHLTHGEIHERYTRGQALWEDFHYYQNAWNRPRSGKSRDVRRPHRSGLGKDGNGESVRESSVSWRENMIQLYNKWNIGDRSKLKKPVGPDQLHIYPDNLRHTVKDPERRKTLLEQFPISDVRLDEEAIAARRKEVERKRNEKEAAEKDHPGVTKHAVTKNCPEGHQLYHAATEHSKPWQYQTRRVRTSWETASWGHAVADKVLVLGKRHVSQQPLYKTGTREVTLEGEGTLFIGPKQERIWDRGKWGWMKGDAPNMITEKFFVRDANGQRIQIPYSVFEKPTFTPADTVTMAHEKDGMWTARRELNTALAQIDVDELSDVQDEDDYKEDKVSPPNGSDEAEEHRTNPPDDSDDDSDDDEDPFTRSYQGLDVDMTDRPPCDPPPRTSPGRRPPTSDNDSEGSDDRGDAPKLGCAAKRKRSGKPNDQRKPLIPGEMIEDGHSVKEDSWVTLKHTVTMASGEREFVQRDEMPAYNPEAKQETYVTDVYPVDAPIPDPRPGNEGANGKWKFDSQNGIYRKGPLNWRPVFVLRKYRRDTGEYLGHSDKRHLFDKVIQSNISKESVDVYNKAVRQYLGRNSANYQKNQTKHPPWTKAEVAEAVRFLNETVRQDGLIHLVDEWDNVVKNAKAVLDRFRNEHMGGAASRGKESIRTKFSSDRAPGLHEKLKRIRDRTAPIPEAELRPESFFVAEDFDSDGRKQKKAEKAKKEDNGAATTEAPGVASKTKKRKAPGKTKTQSKETGIGTKTADGADRDAGCGQQGERMEVGSVEEEGTGDVENDAPPPKRRRKN